METTSRCVVTLSLGWTRTHLSSVKERGKTAPGVLHSWEWRGPAVSTAQQSVQQDVLGLSAPFCQTPRPCHFLRHRVTHGHRRQNHSGSIRASSHSPLVGVPPGGLVNDSTVGFAQRLPPLGVWIPRGDGEGTAAQEPHPWTLPGRACLGWRRIGKRGRHGNGRRWVLW